MLANPTLFLGLERIPAEHNMTDALQMNGAARKKQLHGDVSHTPNLLCCGAVSVLVVFAKLGAALVSAVVVCGLWSGRGCGGGRHGDRIAIYRPIHKVMKFMSLHTRSCKTARKVPATRGQLTFVTDSRSLIVNRPGASEGNLHNAVVSIRAVTLSTEGASTRFSRALCADIAAIAVVFYKSIVALQAVHRSAVA